MAKHLHYTHKQARLLLGGVDGKTFNRWLVAAEIEPKQDPRDQRIKRITRTQLERLASLHGIALLSDEALRDDLEHAASMAALTVDIEAIEQRVDVLEQAIEPGALVQLLRETLQALVREEIQRQIAAMQLRRMVQTPASVVPQQTEAASGSASAATTPHAAHTSPQTPKAASSRQAPGQGRRHVPSEKKDEKEDHQWSGEELFAENWVDDAEGRLVSVARMCQAHHIPGTTMNRAIGKELIPIVKKRLLFQGAWKVGGLNAEQRRQVWLRYHDQQWFVPCAICLANGHQETEGASE